MSPGNDSYAATVPDMDFLLEKINTSLGTWYASIYVKCFFFFLFLFLSFSIPEDSSLPSLSYLRDISTL